MSKKSEMTEASLRKLYLDQGQTIAELAAHFGCGETTIGRWLRKYNIPIRPGGQRAFELPRDELYTLYAQQDLSVEDIAARYQCSTTVVYERLRAYDIPIRSRGNQDALNLPYDELYEQYVALHKSVRQVAEHFGCGKSAILNYLNAYHIPVRRSSDYEHPSQQLTPPELYIHWAHSPSPDLAYALGQFAADGCLSNDYNEIELTSTDIEMLDLFAGCIQLDTSIQSVPDGHAKNRKDTWKPAYRLRFSDRGFRLFLESVGFTPAKSKTIGPLLIPDAVFPDFARGCWDGDGTWTISNGRHLNSHLISGSPAFLVWMQTKIEQLAGLRGGICGVRLVYTCQKAIALGHWLYYAPGRPGLSHKRAVWQRYAQGCPSPAECDG